MKHSACGYEFQEYRVFAHGIECPSCGSVFEEEDDWPFEFSRARAVYVLNENAESEGSYDSQLLMDLADHIERGGAL